MDDGRILEAPGRWSRKNRAPRCFKWLLGVSNGRDIALELAAEDVDPDDRIRRALNLRSLGSRCLDQARLPLASSGLKSSIQVSEEPSRGSGRGAKGTNAEATGNSIGCSRSEYGMDSHTCGVLTTLDQQSPDMGHGRRLLALRPTLHRRQTCRAGAWLWNNSHGVVREGRGEDCGTDAGGSSELMRDGSGTIIVSHLESR